MTKEYERQGPAPHAYFGLNCDWLIDFCERAGMDFSQAMVI